MHVLILFSILVLLLLCRMMHKTMEGLDYYTKDEIDIAIRGLRDVDDANTTDHTKFKSDIAGLTASVGELDETANLAFGLGYLNTYLLYPYIPEDCDGSDLDKCKLDMTKFIGATGPKGIQGAKGDKGDKGDTGERGYRGYRGYSNGSCTIG